MKCTVSSQNVKIVARAIHSLSKIGDELYIEPTLNDLIFCAISSAQSALCEFRMFKSFFSSYNFTVEDSEIKCKIAMKSCLGVFKNPHCADKQVESCEIRFKPEGTVVIFYIKYVNSSTKKFFLPIIDSEKLEVNYEKDAANKVLASSKLLASSFKNFRSNEDEITVKVATDKIIIKNHLEPGRDRGLMRTELSFQPSEFDCCWISSPTAVTFTLKEMRAAINFAEPANLPINMHITKPGDPLVLKVANPPAYESIYIIATLRPSRMDLESTSNTTQVSSVASRQMVGNPRRAHEELPPDVSHSEPVRSETTTPAQVHRPDADSSLRQESDPLPMEVENIHVSHDATDSNRNRQSTESFKRFSSKSFVNNNVSSVDAQEEFSNVNIDVVSKIFKRCFVQNFVLDSLSGSDVVLCQSSDSE